MSLRHGNYTNYPSGACRCGACTDAWAAYERERYRQKSTGYADRATDQEVRLWALSLGFTFPRREPRRQREALIARYNREHPERPYLRPEERSA